MPQLTAAAGSVKAACRCAFVPPHNQPKADPNSEGRTHGSFDVHRASDCAASRQAIRSADLQPSAVSDADLGACKRSDHHPNSDACWQKHGSSCRDVYCDASDCTLVCSVARSFLWAYRTTDQGSGRNPIILLNDCADDSSFPVSLAGSDRSSDDSTDRHARSDAIVRSLAAALSDTHHGSHGIPIALPHQSAERCSHAVPQLTAAAGSVKAACRCAFVPPHNQPKADPNSEGRTHGSFDVHRASDCAASRQAIRSADLQPSAVSDADLGADGWAASNADTIAVCASNGRPDGAAGVCALVVAVGRLVARSHTEP